MDSVHPTLTAEIIAELPSVDTSEMNPIDAFVHDYSVFTKLINLIILHKPKGYLQPMLKMYTDVSTYVEKAFTTGDIFENDCADFSDGICWLFNEMCPDDYSYEKGTFKHGVVSETT